MAGLVLRTAVLFATGPLGMAVGILSVVVAVASVAKSGNDYSHGKISGAAFATSFVLNAIGAGGSVAGPVGKALTIISGPYSAYSAGAGYLDITDSKSRTKNRRR